MSLLSFLVLEQCLPSIIIDEVFVFIGLVLVVFLFLRQKHLTLAAYRRFILGHVLEISVLFIQLAPEREQHGRGPGAEEVSALHVGGSGEKGGASEGAAASHLGSGPGKASAPQTLPKALGDM